ncbi:MAG: hypothetical protein ACE1Z4_11545 [Gammaproteobacteria bacterium]
MARLAKKAHDNEPGVEWGRCIAETGEIDYELLLSLFGQALIEP